MFTQSFPKLKAASKQLFKKMATSAGMINYLKNNLYSKKTMRKLAKFIRINFFRTLEINQMAAIIIEHLFKKNA